MGAKFFVCEHCGNLVGMIHDAGVPMMCCGQKMTALVSYFLYIQKNKVMLLQQQIGDLKNKMSILEKQELAAEQHNNFLRQEANTVHLYASLSLEETRKTSIKEKQSQIIRSSEHILELLNSEKV